MIKANDAPAEWPNKYMRRPSTACFALTASIRK
jgi:hypothetical protein